MAGRRTRVEWSPGIAELIVPSTSRHDHSQRARCFVGQLAVESKLKGSVK
jgi:hypothetical protein